MGRHLKRQGNQPVTKGQGCITAISRPDRGPATAHGIAIGNIIMNEGGVVQQFDGCGPVGGGFGAGVQRLAG